MNSEVMDQDPVRVTPILFSKNGMRMVPRRPPTTQTALIPAMKGSLSTRGRRGRGKRSGRLKKTFDQVTSFLTNP